MDRIIIPQEGATTVPEALLSQSGTEPPESWSREDTHWPDKWVTARANQIRGELGLPLADVLSTTENTDGTIVGLGEAGTVVSGPRHEQIGSPVLADTTSSTEAAVWGGRPARLGLRDIFRAELAKRRAEEHRPEHDGLSSPIDDDHITAARRSLGKWMAQATFSRPRERWDESEQEVLHGLPTRIRDSLYDPNKARYNRKAALLLGGMATALAVSGATFELFFSSRGMPGAVHGVIHGFAGVHAPTHRGADNITDQLPPYHIGPTPSAQPRSELHVTATGDETLYQAVSDANIPRPRVMPTITNAMAAAKNAGYRVQQFGTGTHEWFKVNGQSAPRAILKLVGKFFKN